MAGRSTRPVTDPGFPHGTYNGYQLGCRRTYPCPATPCCTDTYMRQSTTRQLLRLSNTPCPTDRVDAAEALAVLDEMHAALGSYKAVAMLAGGGMNATVLAKIHAKRPEYIWRKTRDRIMRTATRDPATAPRLRYPADRLMQIIGALAAQGYPVAWTLRQMDTKKTWPISPGQKWVTAPVLQAAQRIAATVGETTATPENTGLPLNQIHRATGWAREHGYHPLDCYDDDGNLNGRLIPGHPWAEADARCSQILWALREVTKPGRDPEEDSYEAIAERVGMPYIEDVQRAVKKARIRATDPDQAANIRRVRDVLAEVDANKVDYVRAAINLGVVKVGGNYGVPEDHPAAEPERKEKEKDRAETAKRKHAYEAERRAKRERDRAEAAA